VLVRWDSEGIGVSQAKTTPSGVSDKMAVVHEIRWRFTAQQLEDNNGQFEDDPLLHWQSFPFMPSGNGAWVHPGFHCTNWSCQTWLKWAVRSQTWELPYFTRISSFANPSNSSGCHDQHTSQ